MPRGAQMCARHTEARMYFRKKVSGGRVYLQIAESRRVGGQVHQRVITTLGRLDALQASGQLERLVRSGARFAANAMVLTAALDAPTAAVGRIGPALVFERLWAETGCRAVIEDLAEERKHGFALERAIFLTVLHRLMGGGSDLAADRWREDYRIAGAEALELHHLYRAMGWLGEALPEPEQDARTPFAPHCTKDLVEERLFAHRRDLFSRLDLVFMDILRATHQHRSRSARRHAALQAAVDRRGCLPYRQAPARDPADLPSTRRDHRRRRLVVRDPRRPRLAD